ncbi:MAG: AmmeMemoRadiSam system radical SAM enzyme [Bacteroidales bacterium]
MGPLFLKYDRYIECRLCPHMCKIAQGKRGICGVRKNTGDEIELLTYGVISGSSPDPVEKKPLYHFFPGSNVLSVGSYGCNMSCDFCQNWHISQKSAESFSRNTTPDLLADEAVSSYNNLGLAFTYNEPVIWFEFIRDTALKIKEKGLFTVLVSNGYVNKDPLDEIIGFTDAFNIDLKAFNNDFYKRLTGAEIEPVKNTLKQIASSGKHLEITTLIIPGRNDSLQEMSEQALWIAGELGKDTPLHLSRYFPTYRRDDPPTSGKALTALYEAASAHLDYVYMGNINSDTGNDTKCKNCGTIVTKRSGYSTDLLNLDNEGSCISCGNRVYRYFTLSSRK